MNNPRNSDKMWRHFLFFFFFWWGMRREVLLIWRPKQPTSYQTMNNDLKHTRILLKYVLCQWARSLAFLCLCQARPPLALGSGLWEAASAPLLTPTLTTPIQTGPQDQSSAPLGQTILLPYKSRNKAREGMKAGKIKKKHFLLFATKIFKSSFKGDPSTHKSNIKTSLDGSLFKSLWNVRKHILLLRLRCEATCFLSALLLNLLRVVQDDKSEKEVFSRTWQSWKLRRKEAWKNWWVVPLPDPH